MKWTQAGLPAVPVETSLRSCWICLTNRCLIASVIRTRDKITNDLLVDISHFTLKMKQAETISIEAAACDRVIGT